MEPGRSAGQLVVGDDAYTARSSISFKEFSAQNQRDGMGQVLLEDNVTMVWPTGAVFLKTSGQMFGAPLEPTLLADWQLKHATAWLKASVKTFNDCKQQALQNPEGWDWVSDLKRLKDVAVRAKENYEACHEIFELANGRGAKWRRQQEEQKTQMQLAQQRHDQIRARALAAIYEIDLTDAPTQEDDDE